MYLRAKASNNKGLTQATLGAQLPHDLPCEKQGKGQVSVL